MSKHFEPFHSCEIAVSQPAVLFQFTAVIFFMVLFVQLLKYLIGVILTVLLDMGHSRAGMEWRWVEWAVLWAQPFFNQSNFFFLISCNIISFQVRFPLKNYVRSLKYIWKSVFGWISTFYGKTEQNAYLPLVINVSLWLSGFG